jgi:hypothetical protein
MSSMIALFAAAVHTADAIPYRTNSAVSPEAFAWALFITLLVLAAIVGGLLLTRRRVGPRFWTGGPRVAKQDGTAWRVSARVRLSATARAYVLESKEESYLVIESSQHLTIQPQGRAKGEGRAREE